MLIRRRKLFTTAAAGLGALIFAPRKGIAGYSNSLISSTRYELLPNQPATSLATAALTASGTPGVYGSAVNVGTTSFDYDGFFFHHQVVVGSGGSIFKVTYNNTGTDEPLITDFFLDAQQSGMAGEAIFFPVTVPKGSLIKASMADSTASRQASIVIQGFQGDARMTRGFRQALSATDITTAQPTNSVALNGTTPTAWTTVRAVTAARFAALIACPATYTPFVTIPNLRLDFAVGPPGSEQYLFSTWYGYGGATNDFPFPQGPFPCDISAGSRLSFRGVAFSANTTTIGAALCGLAA